MKDINLINESLEGLHNTIMFIIANYNEESLYYTIELNTIRKILEKIKDCDETSATKCFTCINQINRGDLL